MLKKVALATGVTLLSASAMIGSVSAQSLGDGDIDSIINGLVDNSATTTTTTTTAPTTSTPTTGLGDTYTATTAEGTSLDGLDVTTTEATKTTSVDEIMVEPDSGDSSLEVDTDSIIDDVMVEPSTGELTSDTVADEVVTTSTPAPTRNYSTATPRKVTSTQRLSAAGMDMMTLLVISGAISSLAGLYLLRRKKAN